MTILSGDIKLVASQVMDDVPEGGGAPTSTVIVDGTSNSIFPDISELDRAGGRINLRKVHVHVQTPDRDTYLGGNVVVAEPPQDPNVSITLFSTRDTFDRRNAAKSRIEAYLNKGSEWAGYLYENHIVGQRVIQLFQRPTDVLPNVGQTLVLTWNEGEIDEKEQYVRATKVASVNRTFTDTNGDTYQANVVTLELSDTLRFDLPGSPASSNFRRLDLGTKVRDTVVADAGSYAGVVPLAQPASIGDFTIKTTSIYTQLVPSAQTETPVSFAPPYAAAGLPVKRAALVDDAMRTEDPNVLAIGECAEHAGTVVGVELCGQPAAGCRQGGDAVEQLVLRFRWQVDQQPFGDPGGRRRGIETGGAQGGRPVLTQIDRDGAALARRCGPDLRHGAGLGGDHLGLIDLVDDGAGGPVQSVGAGVEAGGQDDGLPDFNGLRRPGRIATAGGGDEEVVEELGPHRHQRRHHGGGLPDVAREVDLPVQQLDEEVDTDGPHQRIGVRVSNEGFGFLGR